MTEDEFRIEHSKIIESYQLIEMHLKGICAAIPSDEGKEWISRLNDFESDPLGKLIIEFRNMLKTDKTISFFADDFDNLDEIRASRNYWVHQCFVDFKNGENVVFTRSGKVKKTRSAIRLDDDLKKAIECEKKLVEIYQSFAQERRIAETIGF